MNFSIVLPSRERVGMLADFLKSVDNTTDDPKNVEILIAVDIDDRKTIDFLRRLAHPLVRYYLRTPGKSISVDYQQLLFERSCGDYLFVLNDDVEIRTFGWDAVALEKFKKHSKPDGISYGWTSDVEVNLKDPERDYCPFPIISRRGAEVLGFLMPPYYSGWTADICIHEIYSKASRVVDMREIVAYHKSHWVGARSKDHLFERMKEKSHDATAKYDFSPDIDKLKREISQKNKVRVI